MKTGVLVIVGVIIWWLWSKREAVTADAHPLLRPPPCGNFGDIDGDGFITETDANLIADHVVGKLILGSEQLQRADVNGDGEVYVTDAMLIAQYAKGVINTFPVCRVK